MKNTIKLISILGSLMIVGFGCVQISKTIPTSQKEVVIDRKAILLDAQKEGLIMDSNEIEKMKDPSFQFIDSSNVAVQDLSSYVKKDFQTWKSAALADVTGGQSFGLAHTQFSNGTFTLVSILGGLPVPNESFYYEGWLVKRGESFQTMSTGKIQDIEGKFVNVYVSKQNLSDFDFYVVTLESNDQNTAPAEHLLEGAIQ